MLLLSLGMARVIISFVECSTQAIKLCIRFLRLARLKHHYALTTGWHLSTEGASFSLHALVFYYNNHSRREATYRLQRRIRQIVLTCRNWGNPTVS